MNCPRLNFPRTEMGVVGSKGVVTAGKEWPQAKCSESTLRPAEERHFGHQLHREDGASQAKGPMEGQGD